VGLLRGSGTRFGTWFYAIYRGVSLMEVLKALIYSLLFRELIKSKRHDNTILEAIKDIEDKKFWKACYVLLRATIHMLKLLRMCDSNEPCMDKIYYMCHRTTEAFKASVADLNDETLFPFNPAATNMEIGIWMSEEEKEVFGRSSDGEDVELAEVEE
jgi:hypothetical protein